jgi:uncharacterized membrane-anchored protein YitT (DUF2179 family)
MMLIEIQRLIIVLVGALLNACSLNLFLIPANVYASGFTGAAQLISSILTEFTAFNISTGTLLLLLNIPVAILGWLKVGKSFTLYSFISVIGSTFFLAIVPVLNVSEDLLLNAVFGGVIAAVGMGITLKWGASTGGLDTLVTLYVSTRVIDAIHTRHEKLTAMIITTKTEDLKKAIYAKMVRGITTVPARGAFTNKEKEMMIMVITRYELYDLEKIIGEIDPEAFTNIIETAGVFGFFRRDN